MKLITDNSFSKAWEVICPSCNIDNPNSILWFRKQCHTCVTKDIANKKYTEEDLMSAFNAGINNDYGNGPSFDKWLNSLNKQD